MSYGPDRLVTVETFTTPWEAQLARARLESEGIDCRITDENLGRLGLSNAIGGVKLLVFEEDLVQAAELLRREARLPEIYLVTEEEVLSPRCPGCNSDNLSLERWSRWLLVGSLLLLRFPLLIPRKRWKCRHCGGEWRENEIRGGQTAPEPELETAAPVLPIDPTALVTVARFITPWEAHLARTRLEVEGIDACVHEERLPMVNLLSGDLMALNRLEVIAEDAALAREILAAGEERANRDL
ncbi:MAG TPA: DUF2007 domain-containing protein [Thermoanaerobaculia bacterium]|nr:DUF2007 domain-containing protein [Thermoanaerobaculia bacterium]